MIEGYGIERKVRFINPYTGEIEIGFIAGWSKNFSPSGILVEYNIMFEYPDPITYINDFGCVTEHIGRYQKVKLDEFSVFPYEPDLRDCIKEAVEQSKKAYRK